MKVLSNILFVSILLSLQNVYGNSSFSMATNEEKESLYYNPPSDSIQNVNNTWPDCPEIKDVRLIELDSRTFLVKWETILSHRVEYSVEIRDNAQIVKKERNNSGVYVFQLDDNWSLEDLHIDIISMCYFENRNQPIVSDTNSSTWKDLVKSSTLFCESYEDLITKDYLKSFLTLDTKFPKDVNFTFEICNADDCQSYNHAQTNSAVLRKKEIEYQFSKPKLFTKYGNYECSTKKSLISDPCDGIIVEELENCLYNITYPDSIAPVCDLGLYSHKITHSLCGHPTGKIIVRPYKGNKPYHYAWSTGDQGFSNELSGLLPGTYTVTVTDVAGCEIESTITIVESTSVQFHVNGGNGGLQESLTLPAGMNVTWKFNPQYVTDQCIITGQGLDVDTGPITNGTQAQCSNSSTCSCSTVFMGDYNSGDALPIAAGSAVKSGSYAVGDIVVPSDGQLNIMVVGANCGGGTAWTLLLQCTSQSGFQKGSDIDVSYVQHVDEVRELYKYKKLTKTQFYKDSIEFFEPILSKSNLRRPLQLKSSGNNPTILDFRCSGHVESPYTIRMENKETGEIYECDIIDEVSCPECDEETDGCDLVSYSLESNPWDPFCTFEWKVEGGTTPNLEILSETGGVVLQSAENIGSWQFESGKVFEAYFTLENDTLSQVCSFKIDCPEPDLPPIDESLCKFFNYFNVSLENESSLYFSSEANLTQAEIDEFNLLLSQISDVHLNLQWNLGPPLFNHLLFNANNSGAANLFQLDPENMTFILNDYDMNNVWNQIMQGVVFDPDQRRLRFQFVITDIYGNTIVCDFETIVEFPEEEKEEENPLCLSCGDGVYDPSEDLGGYTLDQGQPFTGNLNDKIVHIYGFPIYVTAYSNSLGGGEGILSLPFEECKVLAVDLKNLEVVEFPNLEKRLWIKSGQIIPNDLYPGELPNFEVAPDFVIGAEICVPPRGPNDVDGDGIDDNTKLDKYGFDENGNHINGTKLDDNGFDVDGNYMGCPRTDDPNLDCTMYNEDGCNRDGLDEEGNRCPAVDDEEWNEFIEEYEEIKDSLIASIICDYASKAQEETDEKVSDCDSLRTVLTNYIVDAELTSDEELLIKGSGNIYINERMSDHFNSAPKVPSGSVGGRKDIIEDIEKAHVDLYNCDIGIEPLEEKSSALNDLCSQNNTADIQDIIDQALAELSNLDRQRLMLDENAFKDWVENLIKEFLQENHNIYVSAVIPNFIELNLFDQPTKAYYQGSYTATASIDDEPFIFDDFNIMDAIDFEYGQGFDVINGVNRGFYVAQLGRYNQENYSSFGGQEPIAIQNVQKSSLFSIYLVNFRFFVDQPALVDAYIELSDPKSDRKIYFAAKDVKYNPDGIEKARMELATTISKFRISNSARGTILKGPKTYLDFDCGGVKEFGLEGEVEFCDNIIVPMQQIQGKNDFERHDSTYFKMGFETVFQEWLEFETRITAKSPFAMAKQEDLIWIVPEFNFDFSSSSSDFASGFNVPSGFKSEFVDGSTLGPGWKGFYCPSLSAVLPAITKSDNGDRFTAASVTDLLIDKYGVTCSAEVSAQILGLGKPNMKSSSESTGWSLSIDYFRIDAVQNFIVGGGIRGQILTSLFKDDDQSALDYSALILPGHKYKFSVSPKVDLEVPLLVATAEIKRSAIDVLYDAQDESFTAQARFTGNLKIDNDIAGASLPYLKFTNLTVNNKAPYISSGKWELKSGSDSNSGSNNTEDEDSGTYKGFRFSLDNISFASCDGGPILYTTINVGFGLNGDNDDDSEEVKSSNLNIAGDFGLKGKFSPFSSGIQGFKFEKPFLNGLSVSGNIGEAVKEIDVKLCWDDDHPEYGDTFYGSGKASILNFGEVGIAAQFGKKDDEKYFFVDAFADLPTPLPIGGPVGIDQIGIGVSNNMRIESNATGSGTPTPVEDSEVCSPPACASNFGQTYTGFRYRFDASKALAMRASVGFGMITPPKDFIDGSAGIDITFNDEGGIAKFGFFGEATILSSFPGKLGKVVDFINKPNVPLLGDIDLLAEKLNMDVAKPDLSGPLPIMARVEGSWNFESKEFDLTAGAFLDWGVLKGAGHDNALVLGKIYIGDGWHVHLGTHRVPSGVELNLGIINASFKTYFMAGNPMSPDDPWEPYLPPKVKSFFYESGEASDFTFLQNMPSNGAGIAFGVHFEAGFNASVPVLGGFEAELMAGIDVALINGMRCNGNPIGLGSGWYAMGQGYLYAGAGLNVLGVDLIKGEAGVLLNAGIGRPHQSFFNGRMKVKGSFGVWPLKFSISGNIKVEVGNEPNCDWYVFDEGAVAEVLGEISIVESTFPTTESKDISTNIPEYIINYTVPMGEILELTYQDTLQDQSIVDKTVQYRVDISKIEFISTKTDWSRSLNPHDNGPVDKINFYQTFASDDSILVQVTYNVDMKIPDTDDFVEVISGEILEYNFKTGPLELRFEPSNIASTWPENGMDNFYLDHRLDWAGSPHGIVSFENSFPWEIFQSPGVEVRTALYQGDNVDPLIDTKIDPYQGTTVEGEATNAGSLVFELPQEMELGKHYKVTIYATVDTSDVIHQLMDPIHFRTSYYPNLELKFAEVDSMYYVEASPRWGSENIEGTFFNYTCGFEYNLVSKEGALEDWDAFDAKLMRFYPTCDFDNSKSKPQINSTDFVDCEFNGLDEPPGWHQEQQYALISVGDLLTIPNNGSSSFKGGISTDKRSSSSSSASFIETGPSNVSLNEVYLVYKSGAFESLDFSHGHFLLKGCQ